MHNSALAIALAAGMANGFTLAHRRELGLKYGLKQLAGCPHLSRGKSGKSSPSRSNAAAFKRAAKKRNNIRKHK